MKEALYNGSKTIGDLISQNDLTTGDKIKVESIHVDMGFIDMEYFDINDPDTIESIEEYDTLSNFILEIHKEKTFEDEDGEVIPTVIGRIRNIDTGNLLYKGSYAIIPLDI